MDNSYNYNDLYFHEYLLGNSRDITRLWGAYPEHVACKHPLLSAFSNTPLPPKQIGKRPYLFSNLAHACEQITGIRVIDIDYPGGLGRSTCRLYLENGQEIYASRRPDPARSRLEAFVTDQLSQTNAPISRLIAFNGFLVLQEKLEGIRLAVALQKAEADRYKYLLERTLDSLLVIYQEADRLGLEHKVPLLGAEPSWLTRLTDLPAILGIVLDVPCPKPEIGHIHDILLPLHPRFVKWDARPGNAIINQNDEIFWFDWEHCGARNRLDDLVWVLCDEFLPDYPDIEDEILEQYLPLLGEGQRHEDALRYCRVAGVLHFCVRIGLILSKKQGGAWWDMQDNLKYDEAGVTLVQTQQLCYRASRWAAKEPLTRDMSDWFLQIAEKLAELPEDSGENPQP